MADEVKVMAVIGIAEREEVGVVALVETWFNRKDHDVQMNKILDGTDWTWVGRRRRKQKRGDKKGSGGVGFLVRRAVGKVIIGKDRGCNGLAWIKIDNAGTITNCIVTYFVPATSPRFDHNDKLTLEFEKLMAELDGERNMVAGDWNGRIGELPSVIFKPMGHEVDESDGDVGTEEVYERQSRDKEMNKQGKDILDLMNAAGIVVMNGVGGREMQFTQTDRGCTMVNYVGITENLIADGEGAWAVDGSDLAIGSDHRMVVGPAVDGGARTTVVSTAVGKQNEEQRKTWKRGNAGTKLWNEMRELGEREMADWVLEWADAVLDSKEDEVDIDATWKSYRLKSVEAMEATIGKRTVRSKKCQGKWYEHFDAVAQKMKQEARGLMKKIRDEKRKGRSVEAFVSKYRGLKAAVKRRLNAGLKQRAEKVIAEVEQLKASNPRNAWKKLKSLIGAAKGGKKADLAVVIDAKGEEKRGEAAKAAVREAFHALGVEDLDDKKFDQLFARRILEFVRRKEGERIECMEELDGRFSVEELQAVLKRLKNGKAAGVDDIIAEWLKHGGERMTYALWVMVNSAWATEKCPQEWGKGAICLLYKDGDKRDPLNYRGITLLSVVGKVFAALVNVRLMQHCEMEERLVDEQAGFRAGRACVDQIFILNEVLTSRRRKGLKTFCCFVDVKKAYDRVWRDGLWAALWQKGVRGKMWRVIKNYYDQVESCVYVNGGQTEWFEVNVGVRQGCVLSPILFAIFIDALAREIKDLGFGVDVDGGEKLALLLYADDIVLVAESERELQEMMCTVQKFCHEWRMELNRKKTKVVVFGTDGLAGTKIKWDDGEIEEVEEYKYLGLLFVKQGWKKAKETMVRKAKRAMLLAGSMVVRGGNMSVKAQINMWNALIRPHLEYGAEVMNTERDFKWEEAEALQRQAARRILQVGRRTTNEVVLGELGWGLLIARRMMLRLSYWGKIMGMGGERWVRRTYEMARAELEADPGVVNWCGLTRKWLKDLKLEDHWDKQDAGVEWTSKVRSAVQEWGLKKWEEGMRGKPKTENYVRWKKETGLRLEEYLREPDPDSRRTLTKFRGGVSELRVETGRWEKVSVNGVQRVLERHERLCQLCFRETEDEEHVVLRCPAYASTRRKIVYQGGDADAKELAGNLGRGNAVMWGFNSRKAGREVLRWVMAESDDSGLELIRELFEKRRALLYMFQR